MLPCAQALLEELRNLLKSAERSENTKASYFAGVLCGNGVILALAGRLRHNGPAAGGRRIRSGHAGIENSEYN
jgi:hypothetical protein